MRAVAGCSVHATAIAEGPVLNRVSRGGAPWPEDGSSRLGPVMVVHRSRGVEVPSEMGSGSADIWRTCPLEVPRSCPHSPHLLRALPVAPALINSIRPARGKKPELLSRYQVPLGRRRKKKRCKKRCSKLKGKEQAK